MSVFIQKIFSQFVRGWQPEAGTVLLQQNRVYVLPTRAGLFFIVVLGLLLLGAINYSLALGYVLTFFLGSIALTSLFHTFRNLAYIELQCTPASPVFAGQMAQLPIMLRDTRGLDRHAISLSLKDQGTAGHKIALYSDIPANAATEQHIAIPTIIRGYLPAPSLRLETRFPLGLWRAWSYWTPLVEGIVYPVPERPTPALPLQRGPSKTQQVTLNQTAQANGQEDLSHLAPYRPGDNVARIDWKASARQDLAHLYVKQLEGQPGSELWLDWQDTGPLPLEARLARLCAWVVSADEAQQAYGLRLPTQQFEPAQTTQHRQQCLAALALYNLPAPAIPPLSATQEVSTR